MSKVRYRIELGASKLAELRVATLYYERRSVFAFPLPPPLLANCVLLPARASRKCGGRALHWRGTSGLSGTQFATVAFSKGPFSLRLCTFTEEYGIFRPTNLELL